MLVVTVMYPNREDATFDHDYYATTHMKLVDRLWRPMGLSQAQVLRGITGADGKPPPYVVMTNLTFPDAAAFARAADAHGAEIFKDVRQFTNIRAQTQLSEQTGS